MTRAECGCDAGSKGGDDGNAAKAQYAAQNAAAAAAAAVDARNAHDSSAWKKLKVLGVHVPVIVRRGASGLLAVCSENVHGPATVRRDASEVGVKEFYRDECCFSIGKYSLLSISKEFPNGARRSWPRRCPIRQSWTLIAG